MFQWTLNRLKSFRRFQTSYRFWLDDLCYKFKNSQVYKETWRKVTKINKRLNDPTRLWQFTTINNPWTIFPWILNRIKSFRSYKTSYRFCIETLLGLIFYWWRVVLNQKYVIGASRHITFMTAKESKGKHLQQKWRYSSFAWPSPSFSPSTSSNVKVKFIEVSVSFSLLLLFFSQCKVYNGQWWCPRLKQLLKHSTNAKMIDLNLIPVRIWWRT